MSLLSSTPPPPLNRQQPRSRAFRPPSVRPLSHLTRIKAEEDKAHVQVPVVASLLPPITHGHMSSSTDMRRGAHTSNKDLGLFWKSSHNVVPGLRRPRLGEPFIHQTLGALWQKKITVEPQRALV
jgi:hypothetical protein